MTRIEQLRQYPWRVWSRQLSTVVRMELRKLLFRWRNAWIYLLAFAPVGIILIHLFVDRRNVGAGMQQDIVVLAGIFQFYYLRLAIFFGCLGIFMRLIRGEMIERSLHYYLLAPVRRELVVLGKFIAAVITSAAVFGTAVFCATSLMYLRFGARGMQFLTDGAGAYHLKAYLGITILACLGYGAVFLALSMIFKNPVVPAIVFFGWEAINPILSPFLQKLSITFYLRHLVPVQVPGEGIFALLTVVAEPVPAWAATLGVVVLTAVVVFISCILVRTLEISYTTE
jgi:ABC-type transport system involved in multi-copper enzyme maturation permease subunit